MTANYKQQPRATSIHRVLARRLIYTALTIALAVAIMVSLAERHRIVDTVADRALQRSIVFNTQHQALLAAAGGPDRAGLQQAVAQLVSTRLKGRMGHFIYAELYDSAQIPIGEFTDPDFTHIDAIKVRLENNRRPLPAAGDHFQTGFWPCHYPHLNTG